MSWFNSSRKNESAMSRLSKKVFELSLSCAETLKPDLKDKFGKNSEIFKSKYIPVVFEFVYFFLHLTDRYAFSQLSHEKRNRLYDELVPTTIDATIEFFCGHLSKNLKDEMERDFYSNFDNAGMGYSNCKELFLKPEDDTRILEKLKSGAESKSIVGQLTDNLSQIIEGRISLDPFFGMKIFGVVVKSLKKKEIQDLISEVSKEIR